MKPTITSANNDTIKQLRRLASSGRFRRETNQYLAEGVHLVASLLVSGEMPSSFVVAESATANSEVANLIRQLSEGGVDYIGVSDSLFESFSMVHAPVGIVAIFTPKAVDLNSILPLKADAIMLEDIQDPGNIGTILRTAVASGVGQALLSPKCSSPWSPKALRAGMGAQFSIDIYEDCSLIDIAKQSTIKTIATTLSSDSQSLYGLDLKDPVVWIFGSEGAGVSRPLSEVASIRAHIPQESSSVESLNVAAAAAVCLYERYRQTI